MNATTRLVAASPEQVWNVLADGWLYPLWVVGATRMRDVDDGWPAAGTRLHHSVGVWPLVIDDATLVRECVPGSVLELRAAAWPGGEADVRIDLRPTDAGTTVTIEEDLVEGPSKLLPKPVRAPLLRWRNTESLRRLSYLAERRSARADG
jgi:uncharacterized protein YndB with AHSA1/START domain